MNHNIANKWMVVIGGTQRARSQWGARRYYASKNSARRRIRQIASAHDMGVSTVWLVSPQDTLGYRHRVR